MEKPIKYGLLTNVRLSRDERIDVINCKDGVNEKVNIYRNEKNNEHFFVVIEFYNTITKEKATRILFGYHKKFEGYTPRECQTLIGKSFRGEFITRDGFTAFIHESELQNKVQVDKIFAASAWLKLDNEWKWRNNTPTFESYTLNSKFKFGRYKGLTVREVLNINEQYLSECLIKREDFYISDNSIAEFKKYKPSFSLSREAESAKSGIEDYFENEDFGINDSTTYEDWLRDEYGDDAESVYWNLD